MTKHYRCPEILLGSANYGFGVDIWAAGCIFAELILGKPLLPGRDDIDQIQCTFELLGCPSSRIWPELSSLPLVKKGAVNINAELSKYPYNNLSAVVAPLSAEGLRFLNALLLYDPSKRLTAETALSHPYFQSSPLPKEPSIMPTFPSTLISASDEGQDVKRKYEDDKHKDLNRDKMRR